MDEDLKLLLQEIIDDPTKVLSDDLTDEQIERLSREIDPYAHMPSIPANVEKTRAAALSYTNLRADYHERLSLVTLVAFLFRGQREWKVPAENRRWFPNNKRKKKAPDEPFTIAELHEKSKKIAELSIRLEMAEEALKGATEVCQEYNDDLTISEEQYQNEVVPNGLKGPDPDSELGQKLERWKKYRMAAAAAEDAVWGIRYAMTLGLRNYGIEAERRIITTEKEAKKHPNTCKVIDEAPNRYGGLLPGGQQEFPEKMAKKIILDFLGYLFEYNADAHVRRAYDETDLKPEETDVDGLAGKQWVDPHDPERLPLRTLLQKGPKSTVEEDEKPLSVARKSQQVYNAICCLLNDKEVAEAAIHIAQNQDRFARLLLPEGVQKVFTHMPPADVFERIRNYQYDNYESIRAATNTLFATKPDLEFMMAVYDVFEGTDAEVDKQWNDFKDTYQDDLVAKANLIKLGGWTVMTDCKGNRERVDYFNRHTDVLQRMLKQQEGDTKAGRDMLKKRVYNTKAKNIAKSGPDAKSLGDYQNGSTTNHGHSLSLKDKKKLEAARGNVKAARELEHYKEHDTIINRLEATAKERKLNPTEQQDLRTSITQRALAEEMLDVPDDAIQVDMWVNEVDKDGEQRLVKKKIYTQAEAPISKPDDGPAAPFDDSRPLAPFAQKLLDEEQNTTQDVIAAKAIDAALDAL
jgi:hypothetical protein